MAGAYMNTEKNNNIKLNINNIVIGVFLLLFNGAILQTLLIESGISEHRVNIFVSVMQIVQTLSMLLLSKKMDEVKNIIKTYSIAMFGTVPMAVVLILMSFNGEIFRNSTMLLLYTTGVLFNVFYTVHLVLSYKLPYHVMDMSNYGRYTAVVGIVSGIATLLITAGLSFLLGIFSYSKVMIAVYVLSVFLSFVYFFSAITLKRVNEEFAFTKEAEEKINIFTYKPFYSLLIPNFLRGFCSGIVGIMVTIGFSQKILDVQSSSYFVIITNAVSIASCFVYGFLTVKKIEDKLVLISSIGIFLFLPALFIGRNTVVFLAFYGVMYFFLILLNYSAPVVITRIVDYKVIGQYTSWRLLVGAAGTALAGFCCSGMLEVFGAILTMIITGTMQLISGVWYYVYIKSIKNKFI